MTDPNWWQAHQRRSQAGYTLTEVLLVVILTGIILGPLFAWMLLAMRQQPITQDGLIRTAHTGLLSSYFPQDVAVSGAAWIPGQTYDGPPDMKDDWESLNGDNDCIGGNGANGRILAVLWSGGGNTLKTVYSIAPAGSGATDEYSIWRRVCSADTGELASSSELYENADSTLESTTPAVGRTRATCFSVPGDLPCRQVQLIVAPTSDREPAKISAMRRTDAESLRIDSTGNQIPTVRIRVTANTQVAAGSQARRLELVAEARDVDGQIVQYEWILPNGPVGSPEEATVISGAVDPGNGVPTQTHVLPRSGAYSIQLTVTDNSGASRSTYHQVVVENLRPKVVMDVVVTQPDFDLAGILLPGSIALTSAGSHDPDGSIVAYEWELTEPDEEGGIGGDDSPEEDPDAPVHNSGSRLSVKFVNANETFTIPEWVRGQLVVNLTITDNDGATATETRTVTILDPTAPGEPEEPEEPVEPGEVGEPPVAVLVATAGSNVREWTFDGTRSRVDPTATPLQYSWRVNGTTLAATTPIVTHLFASSGPATVILTVTDGEGRTHEVTRSITVANEPIVQAAPQNVRYDSTNNRLYWNHRPGARRYLVDFQVVANGCQRSISRQAVSASSTLR